MKDMKDVKDMKDMGDIDDIGDIGGIDAPFKNKTSKKNSKLNLIVTVIILAIIVTGTYFYISNQNTPLIPVIEPMPLTDIEEPQPVTPEIDQTLAPTKLSEELSATLPNGSSEELSDELIAGLISVLPAETDEAGNEVKTAHQLPSLDDSDAMALAAAQKLSTLSGYTTLLITKDVIRNFVVFIDNISRGELIHKYSPLIKPAEPFTVVKINNEIYLNEESYHRYDLYVDIINSINIDFAIAQYRILKPLFNDAYQELGYSENEFESTLYDAIETVLNAPIVRDPIKLVAPSAMYKFADTNLEALPSADKLMLRMGPDNMLKLRVKLQEIQIALEGLSN